MPDGFLPEQLPVNAVALLGLELGYVCGVAALPFHPRDPFDGLLEESVTRFMPSRSPLFVV